MDDYEYDIYQDFTVWKTRDGRLIPICEMSDSHLLNTIRAIEEGRVCPVPEVRREKNTGTPTAGSALITGAASYIRRRWLESMRAEAERRGISNKHNDRKGRED